MEDTLATSIRRPQIDRSGDRCLDAIVFASDSVRARCDQLLCSLGVPAADREDVIQDVLVKVVEWLHEGWFDSDRGKPDALFYTALRNRAIDMHRRKSVQLRHLKEQPSEPVVSRNSIIEVLALRQALLALPRDTRQVLRLRLAGMSTRDIALQLRRSVGRTGALMADGKKRLRKTLTES